MDQFHLEVWNSTSCLLNPRLNVYMHKTEGLISPIKYRSSSFTHGMLFLQTLQKLAFHENLIMNGYTSVTLLRTRASNQMSISIVSFFKVKSDNHSS